MRIIWSWPCSEGARFWSRLVVAVLLYKNELVCELVTLTRNLYVDTGGSIMRIEDYRLNCIKRRVRFSYVGEILKALTELIITLNPDWSVGDLCYYRSLIDSPGGSPGRRGSRSLSPYTSVVHGYLRCGVPPSYWTKQLLFLPWAPRVGTPEY